MQKGVPDSGRSEKREQGKHGSVLDSSTAERIDKEQIMIQKRLGKELLFFDGGMGTLLQEKGLEPGELPELWNITHPDEICSIHRRYMEAGSDIVLTNTFGANALKFHDDSCSLEEIIHAAVGHVKTAAEQCGQSGQRPDRPGCRPHGKTA